MGKIKDFIRWTSATVTPPPASSAVQRVSVQPLQLREAHASLHVSHTIGKPQWPRYSPDAFDKQAYQRISLIYRCINLVASSVAEAPVRVYDERDGQDATLPDHPLRQLLTRPNPLMGEAELFNIVTARAAIFGFSLIEIERGSYGRPIGLWPLRSEWAKPIPRTGEVWDWEYTVPGRQPVTIPGDDVCVFAYAPSANGDPRGLGPLEVALREWSLLSTMQDYLKAFFDNGALPVYGLILDSEADFTDDDAAVALAKWKEKLASGDPPFMESIEDIKRLSFDYNELAYTDLRDVSEIAILQAFGVPGSLVGQRYAQERSTFSNYGEARRSFYQDTIQKLWARLDDVLTRSLLPEFETRSTIHLEFDTSRIDALQEDQQQRRTHLLDAMRAGAITRADYRRELGLPIVPADDVYLVPFSSIETPAGQSMPIYRPLPETTTTDDQRAKRERRDRVGDRIQQRNLRIYGRLADRFAPEIQAYFDQQKALILQAAERSAAAAPETRDVFDLVTSIDWEAEDGKLADVLARVWMASGQEASTSAEAETGIPSPIDVWDISNPKLHDVQTLLGQRVTGINDTTKADIAQIVTESLDEGVSIPQLSERLEGLYEETYRGRSTTIARTESQVAYNSATVKNYEGMGVTEVELRDNPNHTDLVGSDGYTCATRHGLIVGVGNTMRHILAEHPNGSLSMRAVLSTEFEW